MNSLLRKSALALTASLLATQAFAQLTVYENEGFAGRSFTTAQPIGDLERLGFKERAASAVVKGERWEVCDDSSFGGRCMVLRPGRYPSLAAMGLNDPVLSARKVRASAQIAASRYAPAPVPAAQVTFYENENFQGRSFATVQPVENLRRSAFSARAASVVVTGERWEACDEPGFDGRCVVLRPGRYPSLASMGLNSRVSSVRDVSPAARIEDSRYAPLMTPAPAVAPVANQDYRRGRDERVYEGVVTSIKAVVGPPEQRCWVERAETAPERGKASIPGAVVGALIGGILGHQVGGGKGQDVATAGGAVAGGVVGANVGRTPGAPPVAQDVKRCENVTSQTPAYYDVTYTFRGIEHRVQLTAQPGPTIPVNERGEPRA